MRRPALWIIPITAILWAASLPSTGGKHWEFSVHFIYTPVALFCGGLVCLALTSPPTTATARVLCAAPLRFFGKYSYGLYVFHFLLYPAFGSLYASIPLPAALHRGALGLAALGVISTIGSLSVAWLSYNLYEKQFLKLKSRFKY